MVFGPRWSPDAKWLLAFTDWESSGGADVIGIRPGVDSTTETFLATKANESEIAISRNGRWLAYDSNESGRDEIYVVPFPKTSSAKWVITSGGGISALWSHSGKELFYRDLAGDVYSVAVNTTANFSAGARKRLFSAPAEEFLRYQGYDVTPDDQRFLMVKQVAKEQPDKLIVVENWFEELKTRTEKPPY
jgi:serine/threonine-protein kinase